MGAPTSAPTASTAAPTSAPTSTPTSTPTANPTAGPTSAPTSGPTSAPTDAPTGGPTSAPTDAPTVSPTSAPTDAPTVSPTSAPTPSPTALPTTAAPTSNPTDVPTPFPVECVQDPNIFFDGEESNGCAWLNYDQSRRKRKCHQREGLNKAGTKPNKARLKCPASCGFQGCCADDLTFTFKNDNEQRVDCAWIAQNADNLVSRREYCRDK